MGNWNTVSSSDSSQVNSPGHMTLSLRAEGLMWGLYGLLILQSKFNQSKKWTGLQEKCANEKVPVETQNRRGDGVSTEEEAFTHIE